MPATVRFVVRGRVQGVGFRWFTTQIARRLDLRGWVRNAADGSVEIVAAGGVNALVQFERELRRGPAGSQVESISREESETVVAPSVQFSVMR